MTKKKVDNIDQFDALTKDEQNEILDELKERLGKNTIKLNMYVPDEVAKWWEEVKEKDKGGILAYEMLMSEFFILSMGVAINEGQRAFQTKTQVAQMVLTKELVYKNGKVYIGSGDAIARETGECDCEDCTCDDNKGENHGGNNTFH